MLSFGRRRKTEDTRSADVGPVPVPGTVAVYFADDPRRLYQLKQWLPVLELLDEHHPVVIVARNPGTHAELRGLTRLRCVLAPAFAELVGLYEGGDFKVCLYVNNSVHNFHSLMQRRMLHVHVNHGESDKVCMVSNQVKAYDRVFVAGEAALRRHRAALIAFDESKLVRVGRPQLDLRPAPPLAPTGRRTILYAPTWEGENASNNYTSVDVLGPEIVAAALSVPDTRVVYKPHPRVVTSQQPAMAAAHREIVRTLERQPGHEVHLGGDILALFPGVDLMVTDVSSVGLDFLYLRVDAPLLIADRHGDRGRLHADAPVSRCADVVDSTTLAALPETLATRLADDVHLEARKSARTGYFGDLAPGESTARFLAEIDDAVATRDRLLGELESEDPLHSREFGHERAAASRDPGRGHGHPARHAASQAADPAGGRAQHPAPAVGELAPGIR